MLCAAVAVRIMVSVCSPFRLELGTLVVSVFLFCFLVVFGVYFSLLCFYFILSYFVLQSGLGGG